MLRHLTKLAQPVRQRDLSDPDDGSIAKRVAVDAAKAKPSSSTTTPSATPSAKTSSALEQRDLRVSFNLLYQAIIRNSDPRLKASQPHVDARLIEDMRKKLVACESERLQLKSDLEHAHQCARAYWDRSKSLKAELDKLNRAAIVPSASRARSTRGAL